VRWIALNTDVIGSIPVRRRRSGRTAGWLRSGANNHVRVHVAGAASLSCPGAPARSSLYVVVLQREVTARPGRGIIVGERERALAFRDERRRPTKASGLTGLAVPLTGLLTNGWSGP